MNFFDKFTSPRAEQQHAELEDTVREPVLDAVYYEHVYERLNFRLNALREIPRIDGSLEEFDFNKMLRSGKRNLPHHKPGFMREARFRDGIWVAVTSADYFSTSAHSLTLPKSKELPPVYIREVIESDSQSVYAGIQRLVGIEEMSQPGGMSPILLGKIALTLEIEHSKNYPGQVTAEEAEVYRKPISAASK